MNSLTAKDLMTFANGNSATIAIGVQENVKKTIARRGAVGCKISGGIEGTISGEANSCIPEQKST